MSERIKKLKHQKQLLEEHLQWLDAEIASEAGQVQDPGKAQPETTEAVAAPVTIPISQSNEQSTVSAARQEQSESDLEELSEQLISQYSHETLHREMDPRLGLLIYFGGALVVIALVIFLFYWFGYR